MNIKTKNVVLFDSCLAEGLNAYGIKPGIKLLLVHIESRRQPQQRCREKTSQQNGRGHGEHMPCNFPRQHVLPLHGPRASYFPVAPRALVSSRVAAAAW